MGNRHKALAWKSWAAIGTLLVLVGVALAQPQAQRRGRSARDPLRDQGGVPLKKARPDAADPLAKVAAPVRPEPNTFHYNFRLRSFDGTPLASSYYPSKAGSSAPVVMLVHEMGRSRKDFEDPVQELKGQGLAEHLQGLGYAVFSMDLRWQGQNPRRALTADERPKLLEDLQAGYFFLVDRHNRGDLNLAKLGIVALGDGANLVAGWAVQPGAGVTIEGHPSDVNSLALISPNPDGFGHTLGRVVASLASRVPLLLVVGERDNASKDAVQSVRQLVERSRLNKVELFPSSLHGYKLLRLEPKVTASLFHFLEISLKNRPVEWEPQYNLTPVTFGDAQMVQNTKRPEAPKAKTKNAAPLAPNQKAEDAKKPEGEKVAPAQPQNDPPPPPPQPDKPKGPD